MKARPPATRERTWMLGCVLALGGCVSGVIAAGMNSHPPPGSVGLPAWTQLNATALRRSGPQTIDILVDEPAHFRAVDDVLHGAHDAYHFELSLKDPSPRLGQTLAKALSKRFGLAIRGIRPSDDATSSTGADLSLFVGTIDWAIDCSGYRTADSYSEEAPTCAVVYRAAVRLEDNRRKAVIAAGNCETSSPRQFLAPDEDPGDRANVPRVQAGLSEGVDDCADKLRHDPLGIYGSEQ
jgi:hypothetical protein